MTDTERLRRLDKENEEPRDMPNQVAWRTVRSDAMEAWRWVCDHGGLENVRDAWDEAVNLCATIGCEPNDESEMLQALGDCTDIVIKRLMPEGMEWPQYESGEMVQIGDDVVERFIDDPIKVRSIEFRDGYTFLREVYKTDRTILVHPGERVRRPAPKVIDADGVEIRVGDTVWDVEFGCEHVVTKVSDGAVFVAFEDESADRCDPASLTHQRPVLDADGVPIRVGDTVWHVHDLDKFTVTNPNNGESLSVSCIGEDGKEYCCYPNGLTHRAPVLAADGRPICEGETVWNVKTGERYVVGAFTSGCVNVSDGRGGGLQLLPSQLTHEYPDSWESLEESAYATPQSYCSSRGIDKSMFTECGREYRYPKQAHIIKSVDLVRRGRALYERERGE